MANKEHLARLNHGVESWNAWRRENRRILPNLYGADLQEVNLSGADFIQLDLHQLEFRTTTGKKLGEHFAKSLLQLGKGVNEHFPGCSVDPRG